MSDNTPNTLTMTIQAKGIDQALTLARSMQQQVWSHLTMPHEKLTQVATTEFIVSRSKCPEECEKQNYKAVEEYKEQFNA